MRFDAVDIIILLILLGAALVCILPVINTLAISLSDQVNAGLGQVIFWPVQFTTVSYQNILQDTQFFRSFLISVERVALGGAINVVLTILMAYPLSKPKSKFKSRDIYMWFVIFIMLFSGGLIPTYLVVSNLHLINTIWSLVLPGAVPVFSVLVLMNFFRDIPSSLEEAAYVDGANPLYILWNIYVPLSMPSIAVILLFAAVGHWNAFFDGMIYINDTKQFPLQTYIQNLTITVDWTRLGSLTPAEIKKTLAVSSMTFNSAKVIVSMIPLLILYPFLQRYFVKGMVLGAVKE